MTNTEQYIRRVVEEELDKAFIENVVEKASKFKSPGFRELLLEETIDYLVRKRIKEWSGEDELQDKLNKCKQIYDDMVQTRYRTDTNTFHVRR